MTTLGAPAPPRPSSFTPAGLPPGVRSKPFTFTRPALTYPLRSAFVHTNGAAGEGSIESAWSWAEAKPNSNTAPHYQVDRDGDAAKFLPSDRRAIGNATVDAYQGAHGDLSNWSLVIETADPGYGPGKPGESAGFTDLQGEAVATILAYEASVWPELGAALHLLDVWYGPGIAGHTDPFGYPYTTLHQGKVCPGAAKKQEIRDWIIPRTAEIFVAWHAPATPPVPTYPTIPGGPTMALTELLDYPADSTYEDAILRKDGNTLGWIGSGHVADLELHLPAGSFVVRNMAEEAASRGVAPDVLTHEIIRTCSTHTVPPPFVHRNGGLRQSWQAAGTSSAASSGDPARPFDGTGAGTY